MFIPDSIVGRMISLLRPLKVLGGTYTIGHIFKIERIDSRGLTLKDEDGRMVIEALLEEGKDYKLIPELPKAPDSKYYLATN
ncbi:hypothetical protein AhSzq1_4 [Aeromonas phage AhSzq-1]|uniref:Uncharacterized protein n=1 Tax=Aeromonas phage AhSzq-1 TaxID=2138298 RepID=A0A2R4ALH8_9CAUD|nr:hypothetical protein HOT03_gp004 [Aeromonas phage AhSzq-1]AVR75897.1 hypothetical protein AhSzq1_4 [Aeromonas phage AhSzq-1]